MTAGEAHVRDAYALLDGFTIQRGSATGCLLPIRPTSKVRRLGVVLLDQEPGDDLVGGFTGTVLAKN